MFYSAHKCKFVIVKVYVYQFCNFVCKLINTLPWVISFIIYYWNGSVCVLTVKCVAGDTESASVWCMRCLVIRSGKGVIILCAFLAGYNLAYCVAMMTFSKLKLFSLAININGYTWLFCTDGFRWKRWSYLLWCCFWT